MPEISEQLDLSALAYDEAGRLYENFFHYHNPFTIEIDTTGVPYYLEEAFCRLVEDELALKGEKIRRNGRYFKIDKYQAH